MECGRVHERGFDRQSPGRHVTLRRRPADDTPLMLTIAEAGIEACLPRGWWKTQAPVQGIRTTE